MIRALLFLCAISTANGDWRQTLSPVTPGPFPSPRAYTASYDFGWASFHAAEAEASFSKPKPDRFSADVTGRTMGFVRTLWRIDAKHTALAHSDTLLPIEMRQREVYRGRTTITELDFTNQSVTKFRESKPDDKISPPRKRLKFPNLLDMHSAFLFVRSQELQNGQTLRFVVYPTSSPYLATVIVTGRETLRTRIGDRRAIKLNLKLQKINREYALEPHTKFKRASAWLSDDVDRLLLKAEADIFVGSVWAQLQRVKFTD